MVGQYLLQNPRVKWGLIIAGGAVLIYLAIGSWLSKIEVSEKKIHQAWLMLRAATDQRGQLIPQFGQLVQTYAPQANEIIQPLAKSYQLLSKAPAPEDQILSQPSAVKEFEMTQKSVVDALLNMDNLIHSYPTLAQNRQYLLLKMQLHSLDEQIKYAQSNVNREVGFYNYHITGFPQSYANALMTHYSLKTPIQIALMTT